MTRVILPPSAIYNLEREQMAERHGSLKWFDRQLRDLDQRLSLVRAKDNASAPGMIPGFWHVKGDNGPGIIDTYYPITNPDGSFAEPTAGWLERWRADDAWSNGGWDAMVKRWDARERSRARDKENQRVARVEELAGRIKAIDNPAVSMSGQGDGWRYRAKAPRG